MSSSDDHPRLFPMNTTGNDGNPMDHNSDVFSRNIMLSAIVVLFVVVTFMLLIHLYARCYLFQYRRRRNHRRRTRLIFYVDPTFNLHPASLASRGLDPTILKSLPSFTFSGEDQNNAVECTVCLSEFESGEKGRRLPNCNHSFHVDCIDMWLNSHSKCPLCRTSVDDVPPAKVVDSTILEVSSEFTDSTRTESTHLEMVPTIEVPVQECALEPNSPASQGLKSPTSRLLSLKRILSREKRPAVGPSGSELEEVRVEKEERVPHVTSMAGFLGE